MYPTSWKIGLGLTLITVSMWSVLPLFLQSALRYVEPLNLNFLRFGGAGLIVGSFLAVRGGLPSRAQVRNSSFTLLPVAALGLAGNYALYLWGVNRVSAAAAQVVIQLAPAMLAVGSVLIFKEPFSRKQVVGFVTLLLGLLVFFNHRWQGLIGAFDDYAWGLALIVMAAVSWVIYALAQKRLLTIFKSSQLMVVIYLTAAAVFLPFADFSFVTELDGHGWFVVSWCVVNTVIAYGAFAEAMQHWESSRVSAVLTLVPLGTICAAASVEGLWPGSFYYEPINTLSLLGALAVVGGSLTVALSRR